MDTPIRAHQILFMLLSSCARYNNVSMLSILSTLSMLCILSMLSTLSMLSMLSIQSMLSILSILSIMSMLSILSIVSILSIMSILSHKHICIQSMCKLFELSTVVKKYVVISINFIPFLLWLPVCGE